MKGYCKRSIPNVESVNKNLNFSEIFKDFSTRELLIILKQPEDYRIIEFEAAYKVLETREISEADLNWVEAYLKGELKRKDLAVSLSNQRRRTERPAKRKKALVFFIAVLLSLSLITFWRLHSS